MRAASCQTILLGLLACGCALAHERGPQAIDASVLRTDAGPAIHPDATAPLDAPTPPIACPLVRPRATCLASFQIQPGRPFDLPYDFDTCGCCVDTDCSVEIDADAHRIALTTTLCPDHCDCHECEPTVGACHVPALAHGTWRVSANGADAFELPVMEDSAEVPPPPACASYASVDHCGPTGAFGGRAVTPDTVCIAQGPTSVTNDRILIVSDCASCGTLDGPCYASLTERLTDDLPRGGDIHLDASLFDTSCDVDCPGVCLHAERTCIVPRLVPGDTYRVFLGNTAVAIFVAGEPGGCP